jgi:hypothetical protein
MVDLFVLTSLDELLLILKQYFFYKTTYLNEEVNCTETSLSVSVSRMFHVSRILLKGKAEYS